jgi:acyl carrier protein
MTASPSRRDKVIAALKVVRPEIDMSSLTDETALIRGLGCSSADGVDLASELAAALDVVIPDDENPLVCEVKNRRRDRSLGELVSWTETLDRKPAKGGPST